MSEQAIQIPYCYSMLLCANGHREPTTGTYTLIGTLNRIIASLPTTGVIRVFIGLTDGLGTIPLRLQFVKSSPSPDHDEEIMGSAEGEAYFADPLAGVEQLLDVHMKLQQPGVYRCELWSGDTEIMARRFIVEDGSETK